MVKPVFIKAQAASLIASLVDFLMTVLFVEVVQLKEVLAAALGTISGGIVNFSLGRYWVFRSAAKPMPLQAVKYLVVWIGNLSLNIGGMTIMVHYVHANYMVSKILISLLVGVFYNYLLQGKFVFK